MNKAFTIFLVFVFTLIQLSSTSIFTCLDLKKNPNSYIDKQGQLLIRKDVLLETYKQSALIYIVSSFAKVLIIYLGVIENEAYTVLGIEGLFTVLHSFKVVTSYFRPVKSENLIPVVKFSGDRYQVGSVLIYILYVFISGISINTESDDNKSSSTKIDDKITESLEWKENEDEQNRDHLEQNIEQNRDHLGGERNEDGPSQLMFFRNMILESESKMKDFQIKRRNERLKIVNRRIQADLQRHIDGLKDD